MPNKGQTTNAKFTIGTRGDDELVLNGTYSNSKFKPFGATEPLTWEFSISAIPTRIGWLVGHRDDTFNIIGGTKLAGDEYDVIYEASRADLKAQLTRFLNTKVREPLPNGGKSMSTPQQALTKAARKLVRGQKGYGVYFRQKSATKYTLREEYAEHYKNIFEAVQFMERVSRESRMVGQSPVYAKRALAALRIALDRMGGVVLPNTQ